MSGCCWHLSRSMTFRLIYAIQIEPFFMSIDRLCQALEGFGQDVYNFFVFSKAGKKRINRDGAKKDDEKFVDLCIELFIVSAGCTFERYDWFSP